MNRKRVAEPYVPTDERDARTIAPLVVPRAEYVVLGDNRVDSCDTRVWGYLPRSDLVGKVVATYWPPGRMTIR